MLQIRMPFPLSYIKTNFLHDFDLKQTNEKINPVLLSFFRW